MGPPRRVLPDPSHHLPEVVQRQEQRILQQSRSPLPERQPHDRLARLEIVQDPQVVELHRSRGPCRRAGSRYDRACRDRGAEPAAGERVGI
ncbi:protein ECERIFERUM 26-like [Iris pallida]|uniref:Protein ECERIFERUM 26-like n=1 Tax=Iris pallida TaxID=29817 RepID=A0AAX6GQ95_IRIPA|nr:protein ECERIFERUM 26-like [Iris pallida]